MSDLDKLVEEASERAGYMTLLAQTLPVGPGAVSARHEAERMGRFANGLLHARSELNETRMEVDEPPEKLINRGAKGDDQGPGALDGFRAEIVLHQPATVCECDGVHEDGGCRESRTYCDFCCELWPCLVDRIVYRLGGVSSSNDAAPDDPDSPLTPSRLSTLTRFGVTAGDLSPERTTP